MADRVWELSLHLADGETLMPIDLILKIIAPFFQTTEQKQQAEQALRDAESKFLEYTAGPLYQAYRVLLMVAAGYDIIFNGGAFGARTADNVGLPRATVALIEFGVALWGFGERLFDAVSKLSAFAKLAVSVGQNKPEPPKPDRPDTHGREDR